MLHVIELVAAVGTPVLWLLVAVGLWPLALVVGGAIIWWWIAALDHHDLSGADILEARLTAYAVIAAAVPVIWGLRFLARGLRVLARRRRRRVEKRWEALVERLGDEPTPPESPSR